MFTIAYTPTNLNSGLHRDANNVFVIVARNDKNYIMKVFSGDYNESGFPEGTIIVKDDATKITFDYENSAILINKIKL